MDSGIQKQKLGPRQQAWIDALRDGEYQQGHDALRSGKKFCCLGVACDLVPGLRWVNDESASYEGRFDAEVLPETVVKYYGFHEVCGGMLQTHMQSKALTQLNDEIRLTFDQIADLIESDPANFFKESK